MSDWIGEQIGKYRVEELLGQGGMGTVYKAFHPILERDVAIKLIHTHLATTPDAVERFRREAKVVAALRHSGIVQVYDFDIEGDTFYMVMEFVRGESLKQRLAAIHHKNEHMPFSEALTLFRLITQAVAYAHSQDVIHRDLKPANVLLTIKNQPVLVDFGLSKIISDERLTADGVIFGTPHYMSPEQGSGRGSDARTDVYALGIMLYELTTGSLPFSGDTPVGIILKHISEPPPPPCSINPDLPKALEQIIQKAIAKEPADRYHSAQELLVDVESLILPQGDGETHFSSRDETLIDERCPYRGLEAFEADHAEFFFGRETLVGQLVKQVADLAQNNEQRNQSRFLAVVGASGGGKSSLVQAGLLPALQQEGLSGDVSWQFLVLRPGSRPLEELSAQLGSILYPKGELLGATHQLLEALTNDGRALHLAMRLAWQDVDPKQRLLLVIDQFEEIFTLCYDEIARHRFIENLLYAANSQGKIIILLTMRADFYHRCADYRNLARHISTQQILVDPMNEAELRRAIERPAQMVGLRFDPGLIDTILADVAEQPGALPLLQHALLELWERRQGRVLTLMAYRDSGGVTGAIAKRAETLYTQFNPEEQNIVRRIMLRLTQPGEGTEDTRRRAKLEELVSYQISPQQAELEIEKVGDDQANSALSPVESVIQQLTAARLLTITQDTSHDTQVVDVAHEALIRGWDRLRNWVDEDRAALRTHRRLTEAAEEWKHHNRDKSYLYQGARLAEVEEWAESHTADLNDLERGFVQASVEAREEALYIAQRTRRWVMTGLATALVIVSLFLLISLALGGVAFWQWQGADAARSRAQAESRRAVEAESTAIAEQAKAERQSRIALAQSLAALAPRIVERSQDTELAALLAMEAEYLNRTENGPIQELVDSSLRDVLNEPYFRTVLFENPRSSGQAIAFNPDGTILASGGYDNLIRLWDLTDPGSKPVILRGHKRIVYSLVFSPDGTTLASGSWGDIHLWDMTDPDYNFVVLSGHKGSVSNLAFSPDGNVLVSGDQYSTIQVWDLTDIEAEPMLLDAHQDGITGIAFSSNGENLATSSRDGNLLLWDATNFEATPITLSEADSHFISNIAFDPDGTTLASNGEDGIILWDLTDLESEPVVLTPLNNEGESVGAFSPDGNILATISGEPSNAGTINLRDLTNLEAEPTVLSGHTASIIQIAFSPDGTVLATSDWQGFIRLWDLTPLESETAVLGVSDGIFSSFVALDYSPEGTLLASGSWDGTIRLWDVTNPNGEAIILSDEEDRPSTVAFNPDGTILASGNGDKTGIFPDVDPTIRLWDITDPGASPTILSGHEKGVMSVAFSPDGKTLASGSMDETIRLWNLTDLEQDPIVFEAHKGLVSSVAFSPDGKTLASGAADGRVALWDVTNPEASPDSLGVHLGGVNAVVFSPDGKILASGGNDGTVRLWDIADSGSPLAALNPHQNIITAIDFNPDGTLLAAASGGGGVYGSVSLWNMNDLESPPVTLNNPEGMILTVAFSPDGKRLASGGQDNTIRLWVPQIDSLIEIGCQKVRRNLSRAEWQQYLPSEPYRKTCPNLP